MKSLVQVFSSGGGTQSCAIAALIIQGKLPKPDFAVIVDTERERPAVWAYHAKHIEPGLASVGVTIHRVPKSRYATVDLFSGKDGDSVTIPAFTSQTEEVGKLPTFCSNEWKLRVMQRFLSREHGVPTKRQCRWIGFSLDEGARAMRMMRGQDYANGLVFFPLIKGVPMQRRESIALAEAMFGEIPPRSACWMCPNQSNAEWQDLKDNFPQEFAMAVALEKEIQKIDPFAWLHGSAVPLGQANFSDKKTASRACDSGACFI